MRKHIPTIVFFAVAFVTYGLMHPEWLNFHEQFQLFQFGREYLLEHLGYASGLAIYIGEFVVQFFYLPLLGAAVWAAVLVALELLIHRLSCRVSGRRDLPVLPALLMPLLIMIYQVDEHAMAAYPVSIILALLAAWGYSSARPAWRVYANIVIIPLLYWLLGYTVLVYIPVALALDHVDHKVSIRASVSRGVVGVMLYVVSALVVSRTVMLHYIYRDIFFGYDYYRLRMVVPVMQHVVALAAVLLVLLSGLMPLSKKLAKPVLAVAMVAAWYVGCVRAFASDVWYATIYVDYQVGKENWDKVIEYCDKNPDKTTYYTVNAVNLALAMKGQLAERMFQFPQQDQTSLIGNFQNEVYSALATAEAYYHLGLVNSSLRLFFDSQECVKDYSKTARCYRRMAELFMINGNYEVAAKYSDPLARTLFYSDFAHKLEACYADSSKIMQDPKWAQIKRFRINDNVMHNSLHLNNLFTGLYQMNNENRMALEYALCLDLLNGDLDHFLKRFPLTQGGRTSGFVDIPRAYQEAITYVIYKRGGSVWDLPPYISPVVQQDFNRFVTLMSQNPNCEELRTGYLSKTFWRYVVSSN